MQFTVTKETHDKLRRVQDLLRHSMPTGDPAMIFDKALTLLLAELERAELAATKKPKAPQPATPGSRHVPAAVRRAVWKRDGGRCAFVGTNGRCTETGWLELHHVIPFAEGGAPTVENLEIRCRAHNQFEAEKWFGPRLPTLVREHRVEFGPPSLLGPDQADGDRSDTVRGLATFADSQAGANLRYLGACRSPKPTPARS